MLDQPRRGRVFVEGRVIAGVAPYELHTPMVFQKAALFFHLTARENVEYPLRAQTIRREARRKSAAETLRLVDLEVMAHKMLNQLSGAACA